MIVPSTAKVNAAKENDQAVRDGIEAAIVRNRHIYTLRHAMLAAYARMSDYMVPEGLGKDSQAAAQCKAVMDAMQAAMVELKYLQYYGDRK